jgi:hypothetical protein
MICKIPLTCLRIKHSPPPKYRYFKRLVTSRVFILLEDALSMPSQDWLRKHLI